MALDTQTLEMDKVAVIILNWNGVAHLRHYLPSVVQHTPADMARVIVADNGSTDESLRVLKEEFPEVERIVLKENYGFAEGYNRAIAEVESEYVVLLNSDVEVTEGWLIPIIRYMDAHPEVAAAQPKVLADKRRTHFEHAGAAGGYIDRWCYPYCRGRVLGHVEEDRGQYDTIADIFWATGACMVVRRTVYEALGGLDSRFFAHMEEIDLCWRMGARGYRLVCIPESVVYHLGGGSLGYESPRKTYLNFRNCMLMVYKNMPGERLWRVMAIRLVLDYVAAAQMLLTGKAKNAWAVVQARWDFQHMKASYREIRRENLRLTTQKRPTGMTSGSILLGQV